LTDEGESLHQKLHDEVDEFIDFLPDCPVLKPNSENISLFREPGRCFRKINKKRPSAALSIANEAGGRFAFAAYPRFDRAEELYSEGGTGDRFAFAAYPRLLCPAQIPGKVRILSTGLDNPARFCY